MAERASEKQSEHDEVVESLRRYYEKRGYNAESNPGSEKNREHKGRYPDVIVDSKPKESKVYVLEVETADSITDEEVEQWRDYENAFRAWFLVVPSMSEPEANVLANDLPNCEIKTWKRNDNGSVTFGSLP
jgi:seryl-tRNA synthetase